MLEKGDQNESVPHPRKERKLRRDEMKAHKKEKFLPNTRYRFLPMQNANKKKGI